MRILHYFLGFPPYRTGGLTKYAFDLMQEQVADGNTVIALWPGNIGIVSKKIKIKKRKSVKGIENYELINPLPVSLDEGISNFDAYMNSCDPNLYKEFLNKSKLDVIHIHTLMGLHKEFIDVAHEIGIKTLFTTHDYFGLCPKVTLYRFGVPCEDDRGCMDCIQCNCNALSLKKIQIMQSALYRFMKNSPFVKQIRKQHREKFFTNENLPDMPVDKEKVSILADKYKLLREYYIKMLSTVDLIHFNSSVTESIYEKYFKPKSKKIMTITHKNIEDNRSVSEWNPGSILKLTLLAPAKPFKGFTVLKGALDELWDADIKNFELKIFSSVQNPSPYMKVNEKGFQSSNLKEILSDTDILVAPSIWYETFGFTVLEAVSYGIPVIVSNHVGAKDIIGNGGIIVEAGNKDALKSAILSLTPEKLRELRKNVQDLQCIKTWEQFVAENYFLYKK